MTCQSLISDLSGVESPSAATLLSLPRTRRGSCPTPPSRRRHTAPPAVSVCRRLLGGVAASSGRHREGQNGANGQNQGFVTRAVPQ